MCRVGWFMGLLFFFFSSRRRHTRFKCDWSSDVCSSDLVGESLHRWRLDPACLTLELTESSIMSDPDHAMNVLERLRALTVRLSIDDFGTGYSSLSHLRLLP